MIILENPVISLIIALAILAFVVLFFKAINSLENAKPKAKSNSKDKKSESKVESSDKSSDSKKGEEQNTVSKDDGKSKPTKPDDSNYLYDRFVVSPTDDDKTMLDSNICSAFLNSKQEKDIHDKKVEIQVSPVVDINDANLNTTDIEKQKLIKEFESMSKEMKLLILENILKKMWRWLLTHWLN